MIIDESQVNNNPMMTNLFTFNFGLTDDSPDELKIFPQDIRIDMCADIVKNHININYLQDHGLLKDFDGLHYPPDRYILKTFVGKIDSGSIFKTLTEKEILLIKHYYGCEIT